jgi:hypothetical protein
MWGNAPVLEMLLVDDDEVILIDPLCDWITPAITKVKVLATNTFFIEKKNNQIASKGNLHNRLPVG